MDPSLIGALISAAAGSPSHSFCWSKMVPPSQVMATSSGKISTISVRRSISAFEALQGVDRVCLARCSFGRPMKARYIGLSLIHQSGELVQFGKGVNRVVWGILTTTLRVRRRGQATPSSVGYFSGEVRTWSQEVLTSRDFFG